MVMDDENIIRELAHEILSMLGYDVETCSCGEELIALYENSMEYGSRPDAVIMDLTIPGKMGGLAAAAAILDLDPRARLIVSSGYSNDPVLANYLNYGFCEAVAKPFSLEELDGSLQRALAGPEQCRGGREGKMPYETRQGGTKPPRPER